MSLGKESLSQIIVGFRFEKAFRVGDIAGEIIDTVLHHKATPFGTDFFPRYQDMGLLDRALTNEKTKSFFRITPSDIILQYTLPKDDTERDAHIAWIRNDAVPFIVDTIINGKGIRNIERVGLMMGHLLERANLGGNIIGRLTGEVDKKADQFSFSFGRKDSAIESLIRKDLEDYVNKLFIMQQVAEETYDLTFDYQYYFNPVIPTLGDWKADSFVDRGMYQLESTFYPFINSLMSVAVGAN